MIFTLLRRACVALPLLGVLALAGGASAQTSRSGESAMTPETARQLIAPFYAMLNTPSAKDVKALAESVLLPDWRSYSGENNSKGREEFVAQVGGFGKLIPDLAWTIKEVFVDGNRIVVRSEASGTPAGAFFGVPHSGKRFSIMAIDIHTVRDGKLGTAHHVEDWAGAIRQLSAQ